jgi:hypothetical protein
VGYSRIASTTNASSEFHREFKNPRVFLGQTQFLLQELPIGWYKLFAFRFPALDHCLCRVKLALSMPASDDFLAGIKAMPQAIHVAGRRASPVLWQLRPLGCLLPFPGAPLAGTVAGSSSLALPAVRCGAMSRILNLFDAWDRSADR